MASSNKKKIRPITSIVWVLGRMEKMPKKGKKMKEKKFVLNKYQKVTRVFTCIFQGLLKKNIVFRSVALVTKK